MKPWLERVVRPAVLGMKPYGSARSLGAPVEEEILLDANESPWSGLDGSLNRYPEPKSEKLVAALSSLYACAPENIFLGRGSDEAIDCLLRCFCESVQSTVLTLAPSYGVYDIAAEIQGAGVLKVTLEESEGFEVVVERVVAAAKDDTRLVFLCSPNNPTGGSISVETVRAVCAAFAGRAVVVLDEAYGEFSDTPSLGPEAGTIENLVVLRTLSKAWGLAGLRVGVCIAGPEIVELMDRVRAPYPLARPVLALALEALEKRGEMEQRVTLIRAERERLSALLAGLDLVEIVYASDANFLLLRLRELEVVDAAARLRSEGVVVRAKSPYLRVSVGAQIENDRLIAAFKKVGEAVCAK
ncbi:MAG: histidinol-phosphate transaminase [Elusimicrobia bacterium]|nr:MAG: histidinol-phosphate transaminase [Elusimicrobiota bacterium]